MIKYLQHKDIDRQKWDECLDNSLNSLIYAKSWYLDIMCPNWECLEIDNYAAVFPIPVKKKYNIKYVYTPFFIQQLGLFFTESKYNHAKILTECINIIKNNFTFIEYNLNEKNNLTGSDFRVAKRINHLLDLNQPYNIIFKNYSHGLKSNLKLAKRNNLEIVNSSNVDLMFNFYKKYTGNKLNKFNETDYNSLKKLIYTSFELEYSLIRLCYHKNELLSAAAFFTYNNRIMYLISASTEAGKRLFAMPFLLDNFIKENSNSHKIFDFEGSMVESIAKFFKSFGSVESVYLQLKINRLPRLIRWLKE